MTDSKTNPAKSPSHIAYHVRNDNGDQKTWTRVGSAWPHADGKGFNVRLDTVPQDRLITLRVIKSK